MQNKLQIILFFILVICISNVKAGPIIVGGAGESEYSIVYTQKNFKSLLENCLNYSCILDSDQILTIQNMINNSSELPEPIFKTNTDMKSLFKLCPDSKCVWINRDLLWLDQMKTVSIDIGNALEIWIHILDEKLSTHHYDITTLAAIVGTSTKKLIQRGLYKLEDKQTFEYILWNNFNTSNFTIRDPALNTLDLMSLFNSSVLNCSTKLQQVQIYSPVWIPLSESPNATTLNTNLHFGISWQCGTQKFNTNGVFYITSERKNTNLAWSFNLELIGLFINLGANK